MLAAVQKNTAPNLVLLNYAPDWRVQNLLLVPSIFFTESVLERRKPLGIHARRARWVGCNILLSHVPPDGKIALVRDNQIIPASKVREQYRKYKKLESVAWKMRGWTLDVLTMARDIGQSEFTLAQIYQYEHVLASLHPQNRNIKAKIRQQLQALRELKILEFVDRGRYRLMTSSETLP
jgi:type II restriction enzyme